MDDAVKLQAQIRHNAEQMQDYRHGLEQWMGQIKKKDAQLRKRSDNIASTSIRPVRGSSHHGTADQHTYDKGYKKWESFDVENALEEIDKKDQESSSSPKQWNSKPNVIPTPGNIVAPYVRDEPVVKAVPNAKTNTANEKPRDVIERETGNDYYQKGNYDQAIKYYTRSIGFNPRNPIVYSNRAMAYLKIKDFKQADADCCSALELDPSHVKSLTRRGTARNAQGRHRSAFLDFSKVLELEPSNKQAVSECNKTRELIKAAARKEPTTRIPITIVTQASPNVSIRETVSLAPVLESEEASGRPTSPVAETLSSPINKVHSKETNDFALNAPQVQSAAQKAKMRLLGTKPKTLYEFERTWKALKGDMELQFQYLTNTLDPQSTLPSLFAKTAMEADLFIEIVTCVTHCVQNKPESLSKSKHLMQSVDKVHGMDMTVMFLSDKDKQQIIQLVKLLDISLTHIK